MLILSQDKSSIINLDNCIGITSSELYGQNGKVALCVETESDDLNLCIGKYMHKARAQSILDEIFCTYGSCDQPKTYEMPPDEDDL